MGKRIKKKKTLVKKVPKKRTQNPKDRAKLELINKTEILNIIEEHGKEGISAQEISDFLIKEFKDRKLDTIKSKVRKKVRETLKKNLNSSEFERYGQRGSYKYYPEGAEDAGAETESDSENIWQYVDKTEEYTSIRQAVIGIVKKGRNTRAKIRRDIPRMIDEGLVQTQAKKIDEAVKAMINRLIKNGVLKEERGIIKENEEDEDEEIEEVQNNQQTAPLQRKLPQQQRYISNFRPLMKEEIKRKKQKFLRCRERILRKEHKRNEKDRIDRYLKALNTMKKMQIPFDMKKLATIYDVNLDEFDENED